MHNKRQASRCAVGAVAGVSLAWAVVAAPQHARAAAGNVNENGFTTPVLLSGSHRGIEPSIAVDSQGRIFVTAPLGGGLVTGTPTVDPNTLAFGAPLWRSTDGGTSFARLPGAPGDPGHFADQDLAFDAHDDVYRASDWVADTAMDVSTDHGQSFVTNDLGNPLPDADRPWLAYSPHDNVLYEFYDDSTALHVSRSLPLVQPQLGLAMPVDVPLLVDCFSDPAVCDSAPVDHCACVPGGIATDPTTGEVYITYGGGGSTGSNVGFAYSTNEGLTWTRTAIPGSGSRQDVDTTSNRFQPIKVDAQGNLYVAWAEAVDPVVDSSGGFSSDGGIAIKFSRSTDHGQTWSTPVTVSTTTGTNIFPTLAVPAPGVVDVGYYGTVETGSPALVADGTPWDVMVATSTDGLSATPVFTPEVAVADTHDGCIKVGTDAGCGGGDGLGDFFQMTTGPDGTLYVAYVVGGTAVSQAVPSPLDQVVSVNVSSDDGDIYVTSRQGMSPAASHGRSTDVSVPVSRIVEVSGAFSIHAF